MMQSPPGPEFNTFTAIARCPKTNRLGIATSTRSLAVGSRVPFIRPRLGAFIRRPARRGVRFQG